MSAADHIRGQLNAPCLLVEYGDYECPACTEMEPAVRRLTQHFGARLAVVFRNFPLSQIHPWAEPAAELAEYAGARGRFWEMHDSIFARRTDLTAALLEDLSTRFAFDRPEIQASLRDQAYAATIRADFMGGIQSGVNGTPTFFINGQREDGALDYTSLLNSIDKAL